MTCPSVNLREPRRLPHHFGVGSRRLLSLERDQMVCHMGSTVCCVLDESMFGTVVSPVPEYF